MMKALLAALLIGSPAMAQEDAWTDIRGLLFEERPLTEAGPLIRADLPLRTPNDLRTEISAFVQAPQGQWLGKVWVVLDNNPMPVSAVFDFAQPQKRFFFDVTMRVNMGTPVHIIAETTSGQLFVAEHFVKTSGTGACAAPPGTDPEEALATLGDMELDVGRLQLADTVRALTMGLDDARLDVDLSHPSHSGLQKDQITLLFIPFRYVEELAIDLDGAPYLTMEGSISLSENPQVGLSIPGATREVGVTMTDTEGAVSTAEKTVGGY